MTDNKKAFLFPYVIIFYEIALYLSNDMYLPSMPTIARDLSLSMHEIQSTLTFWFFGASSLQFFLGPISDRYGRRVVLIAGALLFSLSSVFCALANTLTVLLIARFFQGMAICSLVAAYAAVHELYDTKQAIKLLALISAVTILAPAFGPLLGSLLVQFAQWRYIFWFLVLMGTLSLLSVIFYMPETNKKKSRLHFRAIAMDYIRIIFSPKFLMPCGGYFFLVGLQFIWIFESPFIMIEMYKTSILYYGIAQTMIFSCFFLGAAATKWLLDRYSVLKLVRYSLAITILGVILFLLGSIFYPSVEMAVCCMMIISLGSSMLFGPLNRIAIESCPQPIGMVTAVATTSTSVSGALSGVVLSLIASRGLLVVAILSIVCTFCTTLLIWRMKMPNSIKK